MQSWRKGRSKQRERHGFRMICRCIVGLSLTGITVCAPGALFSHWQERVTGYSHVLIHLRLDAKELPGREWRAISAKKSNRTNNQTRKYVQAGRIWKSKAWCTPGEQTWIREDMRGTIKTPAVPSGPALIATDSEGLDTDNCNKAWSVEQHWEACALRCLHMAHWT